MIGIKHNTHNLIESCNRLEHYNALSVSCWICYNRSLDSSKATPAIWVLNIGFATVAFVDRCRILLVLHWSFKMSITSTIYLTLGVILEMAMVGLTISFPNSSSCFRSLLMVKFYISYCFPWLLRLCLSLSISFRCSSAYCSKHV